MVSLQAVEATATLSQAVLLHLCMFLELYICALPYNSIHRSRAMRASLIIRSVLNPLMLLYIRFYVCCCDCTPVGLLFTVITCSNDTPIAGHQRASLCFFTSISMCRSLL